MFFSSFSMQSLRFAGVHQKLVPGKETMRMDLVSILVRPSL